MSSPADTDAARLARLAPPLSHHLSDSEDDDQSDDSREPAATAGTPALLLGQVRRNGFEPPFAQDQVGSWVGHSASAACFYGAAVSVLVGGNGDGSNAVAALVRWSSVEADERELNLGPDERVVTHRRRWRCPCTC